MWPDDGLELWERDGYAEAMYEKADNDRKAEKENPGGAQERRAGDKETP
jgi:hypothetical protein